jgi:glycine hydroxymethyltransferase
VNFSGKDYHVVAYGLGDDGRIDYTEVERLAKENRPKAIVAGASAYPRQIDFARFGQIAREVGAYLIVDMAHIAGLVATGLHPSPLPHADVVTTTTHKDAARPPRRHDPVPQGAGAAIDKAIFPGMQGGPLEHIVAAKAVCLAEAMKEDFYSYQQQIVKNAGALANALARLGMGMVSGGTDNPPHFARPARHRRDR